MGNIVAELRGIGEDCDEEGKRICNLAADLIERMSIYTINNVLHSCDGCKERDLEIQRLESQADRTRMELTALRYTAAGSGGR
jgi:hypothetical protein